MTIRTVVAAALVLAALSGCGRRGGDQGVGGVTADEAAQLNNAAAMLDASPDSLAAPQDAATGDQDNGDQDNDDDAAGDDNAS